MCATSGALFSSKISRTSLESLQGDFQPVGTGIVTGNAEAVFLKKIVNRNLAFRVLCRAVLRPIEASSSVIETRRLRGAASVPLMTFPYLDAAPRSVHGRRGPLLPQGYRGRAKGCETFRAAFQNGRSLQKSSTPRPEENRAERAVGRTWLEPPT